MVNILLGYLESQCCGVEAEDVDIKVAHHLSVHVVVSRGKVKGPAPQSVSVDLSTAAGRRGAIDNVSKYMGDVVGHLSRWRSEQLKRLHNTITFAVVESHYFGHTIHIPGV